MFSCRYCLKNRRKGLRLDFTIFRNFLTFINESILLTSQIAVFSYSTNTTTIACCTYQKSKLNVNSLKVFK